jgi:putative glutamine amidotransferase
MLKIAITDCSKYDNYAQWLKKYDREIEDQKLSCDRNTLSRINECRALVLTGGGDVDPDLYDPAIPANERRLLHEIDRKRDDFELEIIEKALNFKIPILAVCRGCQITNVYFGGTLIKDLGERNVVHRRQNKEDKRHAVRIEEGSLLHDIVGVIQGEVGGSHHQAAEKVGESLMVSARSEDGVIEGLEYKNRKDKGFLILIQWHPERMADQDNPLCKNIALSFLSSAKEKKG